MRLDQLNTIFQKQRRSGPLNVHLGSMFEVGLAAEAGDDARVKSLLCEGAEVNTRDSRGKTALHYACESDHKDIKRVVDVLLEAGADVNAQDMYGRTPLHMAVEESTGEDSAKALFDETDRRNPRQIRLKLGFHRFLETRCWNTQRVLVDALLEAGAQTNIQDVKGRTALHVAIRYRGIDLVKALLAKNTSEKSKERSSQHLVDHPQDEEKVCMVNATDKYGDTPLHVASETGETETVRLLLRKGAKVGVKNAMGMTPLHKAVAFTAGDIVDILVDFGENVSAKDVYGNTPLHYSGAKRVMYLSDFVKKKTGIPFIINLLIIRGAKIDEQNIDGEKPYEHIAMQSEVGRLEMEIIEETLITQVIRLKTLGLHDEFDYSWIFGRDFYNNAKTRCCQELENMKSTMVVKDISLYQVLSHINHSFLLSPGDLLQIDKFLSSPDLLTRFPLYGDTLRITFQRAKLLTLAAQSFYSETREQMLKKLPLLVVEQLLTLLSNKDLRTFIESE